MRVVRTVRYEEELDPDFADQVAAQPGGERIWNCLQCGTCSAICPVSIYMDRTPRQIIGLIRAGFRQDVLSAISPWICTSCYSCTVECPADIRITDIMYIVKRMALERETYQRFIVPDIEEAFVGMVRKNGRLSEGRMGMKVMMKSGLRNTLANIATGWRMMRIGRLRILHKERMPDPAPLQKGLAALDASRPAKRTTAAASADAERRVSA